ALFDNVKNASELKQRISSQDMTLACALINANLVIDRRVVLLTANRALADESTGSLKTHSLHSEILFNIGATNNIGKTYTTFGIDNNTTQLVAIKITEASSSSAEACFTSNIQGDIVPFDRLDSMHDLKAMTKAYSLKTLEDRQTIESLITSAIALRGH
ncbi:kinase binding protein CGI-121-domain-containing protein, partial [Choanephora cucurbitarum]